MAEYIEREVLLEKMKNWHEKISLVTCVNSIPAADVVPVRRGRWIEQEKYTFGVMYDCSICGNRILDNEHSWNYCPNCGARMDEEEN